MVVNIFHFRCTNTEESNDRSRTLLLDLVEMTKKKKSSLGRQDLRENLLFHLPNSLNVNWVDKTEINTIVLF